MFTKQCFRLLLGIPILVSVAGHPVVAQTMVKGQTNSFAYIKIAELKKGTQADAKGGFSLKLPAAGRYTLSVSLLGFETHTESFTIATNETRTFDIGLKAAINELQEVEVMGKSEAQTLREQGIKTDVISTRKIQNESGTLNEIISRTAGIRVRQVGGLGSAANVSINGFQGKAVKYFKDGIPLDYLSSGFNLNTVPVNLLERVEIYKGVLPTQLGADALGGAVNLVSRSDARTYTDVSYELASFNTHRLSLNSFYQDPETRLFVGVDGFFNHSDNTYKVDVKVIDEFTRTLKDATVRRFHDGFTNYYGEVSVGVTNKPWADLAKFSLSYFLVKKEEQHGALMTEPFGQVTSEQRSLVPTFRFRKSFRNKLSIDQFLVLNTIRSGRIDTCHCTYDWYGNRIPSQARQGESDSDGSLAKIDFRNFTSRTYLSYPLRNQDKLDVNLVYSAYERKGSDPFGNRYLYSGRDILSVPASYQKFVVSAGWESKLSERMVNNLIGKYYHFKTQGTDALYASAREEPTERAANRFGIAEAVKYSLSDNTFLRLSGEYATRLPENTEVFGDGLFEMSNFSLKPEQSINVNLGYRTEKYQRYSVEANVFYRRATDIIVQVPENVIFLQHQNIDKVRGVGLETDLNVSPRKWLTLGANLTYQDLRLVGITDPGARFLEGARVRNTPYFFGGLNFRTNHKGVIRPADALQTYWYYTYVNEFYLEPIPKSKEAKGFLGIGSRATIDSELIIPSQNLHTAGINYSPNGEKMSIGLEVKNVFNANLYDNFRVQRAGRSIHFKLRFSVF
jgi:outer membrane receptor protein involved in Fe transport